MAIRDRQALSTISSQAIVGGRRCPVVGHPSMDLLTIDVTDLSDPTAARFGEMATLIGPEISIDDLAAAGKSTCREVLSHLGRRFHRICHRHLSSSNFHQLVQE